MTHDLRSPARHAIATLIMFALLIGVGCDDDGQPSTTPIVVPCTPTQPFPYPDGIPYVGIHANRENNDVIDCATATGYVEAWHSLRGMPIGQPNTFSPDGSITYVTTGAPEAGDCTLHALRVEDGSTSWCLPLPWGIVASSVEVDAAGDLYVVADERVLSLDATGAERWSTTFGAAGSESRPAGLHFTPGGHLVTVTAGGGLHLVDRADGEIVASLDLPSSYAFVPPASAFGSLDLGTLLPEVVLEEMGTVAGGSSDGAGVALGQFVGAGGDFSDNTVGVSSRDEIFIVGGGPDVDHGSLMQVRIGGTDDAPTLEAGWAMVGVGGSATSPSVTPDGRFVSIGDGVTLEAHLNNARNEGALKVVDVDACDANEDADSDPTRCAPTYEAPLLRGPLLGSAPILPDGSVFYWEQSLTYSRYGDDDRDFVSHGPDGPGWEVALPDGLDWSSIITVTQNHLIGTASRLTLSSERALTITFPSTAEHELLVLDRSDGSIVFRAPITDDSAATVTVGPDGSLYVGLLGLLNMLALETPAVWGLVRFAPTTAP